MNPRLLHTFRRHWKLLSVPLLVVPVIALWMVLGSPARYEASATLWLDTPPPDNSSVTHPDPAQTTQAAQAQSLLYELLRTNHFRLRVAGRGPLEQYLRSNPPAGWSPTALLRKLRRQPAFDRQIEEALAGHVATMPEGPQILTIKFQSEDPDVAAGSLQALVDEFQAERASLTALRARGSVAYFEQQLESARLSEQAIIDQTAEYRRQHPSAGSTDPMLSALREAQQAAAAAVVDATNALHRASVTVANPSVDPSTLRVLDAPTVPPGPIRGRKALVLAVVGGLFAGAVVAFAGAFAIASWPGRRDEAGPAAATTRDALDDAPLFLPDLDLEPAPAPARGSHRLRRRRRRSAAR
jgi:uncharacterized protein involved in exopolysaccharide biosynthesis